MTRNEALTYEPRNPDTEEEKPARKTTPYDSMDTESPGQATPWRQIADWLPREREVLSDGTEAYFGARKCLVT